ncbi:hypothetical protein AAG570_004373 [Ranatra chinensis]|uniref:Orphan sodium-and chloride-dependent neurotransmitter transporter NTT5 n=1 Tax=Ranatra chinensis TaxID=642074 RepID=A0ABD0Y264_9HEMI
MVVYLVLMLLLGVPLVFLEMVLGQLCQEGATKLWRAVPLLKGVGYVKVVCSLLAGCYYPVIMSVSLFYALWTIKGPLPFTECSSALMQTEYLAAVPPTSQSTPMTTTSSQLLADAATASTTTVGVSVEHTKPMEKAGTTLTSKRRHTATLLQTRDGGLFDHSTQVLGGTRLNPLDTRPGRKPSVDRIQSFQLKILRAILDALPESLTLPTDLPPSKKSVLHQQSKSGTPNPRPSVHPLNLQCPS